MDPNEQYASIFTPGRRRRLNIVAVFLNLFIPVFVFDVIFILLTVKYHHRAPVHTYLLIGVIAFISLASSGLFAMDARKSYDPTWFRFVFLDLILFIGLALGFGLWNYYANMFPYYEIEMLQSYPHLDVAKLSGTNVQDAGRVYFAANTRIDPTKSWHFKNGKLYCAAPIVGDNMHDYDFWAVGIDCCSEAAADFRCGSYDNGAARAGLRYIGFDLHYYKLAVKAAGAIFSLKSPDPVFFEWVQDPLNSMIGLRDKGWGNLKFAIQASFTLNIFLVTIATCMFSSMGRGIYRSGEKQYLVGDEIIEAQYLHGDTPL